MRDIKEICFWQIVLPVYLLQLEPLLVNPDVLGVVSGAELLLKTTSEFKNYKNKIEMSKFAYITYEKTLSDLRRFFWEENHDSQSFFFQ